MARRGTAPESGTGYRLVARLVIAGLLVLAAARPGQAKPVAPHADDKMTLSADEMVYDRDAGTFQASGNVEVLYKKRHLAADLLTYDQKSGQITARGHVRISDSDGNRMFADEVELSSDLRDGIIRHVRLLFSDGSRLAAVDARRSRDKRNTLTRAVFSPCKICAEKKHSPAWQIKAAKIIHKEDKKTIVYKNAVLEFFGIPVVYLPYLSHPDPSVKRRSGFMVPEVGSSSFLGAKAKIPYYFVLAPNRDFTFAPLFTTKESVAFFGEYRERTRTGKYSLSGSVTRVDGRDDFNNKTGLQIFRGHIFGQGRFRISDNTRWGFNGAWTTDDTYLRRYGISDAETLTSRLFVEHFAGRSYGVISAYAFQGLRIEDVTGESPLALPMAEYHYVGEPGRFGGRFGADAGILILQRPNGADTRRASLDVTWRRPMVSRFGLVTKVLARLRGDVYYTDGVHRLSDLIQPPAATKTNATGRLVPQLVIESRLPLVRRGPHLTQILEPIVSVVAGPDSGNPSDIPNEDSQSFQFDATDLFAANRFTGRDRFDSGTRINYGLRYTLSDRQETGLDFLIGQSYRASSAGPVPARAGLDRRLSDFIARLQLTLGDSVELIHRLRLDRHSLALRRTEVDLVVSPGGLRLDLGFLDINNGLDANNGPDESLRPDRREVRASARLRLSPNWSATSRFIRNLDQSHNIIAEGGVFYHDDCTDFGITVRRDFTADRELQPSTSVILRLKLKHLG